MLIRNQDFTNTFQTPFRITGNCGIHKFMIEELITWSLPETPLVEITGKASNREHEIYCSINLVPNCVRADDFERGSRKLAVASQLILHTHFKKVQCLTKLINLTPLGLRQSVYEGNFLLGTPEISTANIDINQYTITFNSPLTLIEANTTTIEGDNQITSVKFKEENSFMLIH